MQALPPIISETEKATDFKFGGYIHSITLHMIHPKKSTIKNLDISERGQINALPKFQIPPIISGIEKATELKFDKNIRLVHLNKRPLDILEIRAWAYQGTAQFFWIGLPLLSWDWEKLQTSKFACTFIDWNKNKLKLWEKYP